MTCITKHEQMTNDIFNSKKIVTLENTVQVLNGMKQCQSNISSVQHWIMREQQTYDSKVSK